MTKKTMKQKLAEKIALLAENQTKNYVGKSYPIGVHEPEVPEAVMKFVEKSE